MTPECIPIATLPGTTALFSAYTDPSTAADSAAIRRWYPTDPFTLAWAGRAPEQDDAHRLRLTDALLRQTDRFNADGNVLPDSGRTVLGNSGRTVLGNIERLKNGAAAVVTGQQVALLGGPLLTLLKAATAIRKAQDATAATGREHVPIFWLASEDHDLPEVDQLALLSKSAVEKLTLGLHVSPLQPVGQLRVDGGSDDGRQRLDATLDRAAELLNYAPITDLLRECYAPDATLAGAFGRLLTRIFAPHGLIVMDAASRDFHTLGAPVLRAAIERADELEAALLTRTAELTAAGYHAQVLVTPGHSLLFLLDEATNARLPLRHTAPTAEQPEGSWKAGSATYTTPDLLAILETTPERLSPNALLRPIFQDTILPTAAYIGGPAEIAYFAQSAVLYERIFASEGKPGRVTPILPRLSATLIDPPIAALMAQHELQFTQVLEAKTPDALALRLGARAMPIEGKRKLAAAGNAMDTELTALTGYMASMSPDLGRSANVSASKMRYQMNRLRRLAATFELQKQASLHKQATSIMLNLYPDHHLQERLLGGIQFLARYGDTLPALLIEHAPQECPGHRVIFL